MRMLVLAAGLLLAAAPARAQSDDDLWGSLKDFFLGPEVRKEYRWTGRMAPGGTLEVKGVTGSIRAERSQGREIELTAVRKGRRNDPAEVEVAIVDHSGGLTICAVYPNPGGRANECAPGESGRMSVRNNDVSVEFTLKVPAGVHFAARTVNGSITAIDIDGDAAARTINGSVRLAAAGAARAETVNGSIRASMGRMPGGDAAFKTVNGSITLTLPADAAAVVRGSTVNGSIHSDFPVEIERPRRRSFKGTLGKGGPELNLKAVNGSLRLQRAS